MSTDIQMVFWQPLFSGENVVDQVADIFKVLGTPTREEVRCMNPNYNNFRFPQIKAHPWHKLEACAHPFFDELREPNARLPNGHPFPPLFNFKQETQKKLEKLERAIGKAKKEKLKQKRWNEAYVSYYEKVRASSSSSAVPLPPPPPPPSMSSDEDYDDDEDEDDTEDYS
ncbi:hypothetical protein AHAS_Ahas17G0155300 [Arachis hypogaea]